VAALTDIDQVKSLLGYDGSERDVDLQVLVEAASAMIREHTGRRFTVGPDEEGRVEETRTFYPEGRRSIYVDELFSADDITSVVDSSDTALSYNFRPDRIGGRVKGARLFFSDRYVDYSLYPPEHSDFFIRNMHNPAALNSGVFDEVSITATFGWGPDTPRDLSYIAARTVVIWYKGELAHYASTFNPELGEVVVPEKLPGSVMKQLRDWKLAEFVGV
jgi:hypothetical protein